MEPSLVQKILRHNRVAIDANIYIYALNNDSRFPTAGELLKELPKTDCEVYTSIITVTELLVPVFRAEAQEKIPKYLEFISGKGLITIVDVNRQIALKAAELRAKYQLKTPDAIQLATALNRNVKLFVTADKDFKVTSIETLKVEKILSI